MSTNGYHNFDQYFLVTGGLKMSGPLVASSHGLMCGSFLLYLMPRQFRCVNATHVFIQNEDFTVLTIVIFGFDAVAV